MIIIFMNFNALNFAHYFNFNDIIIFNTCSFHFVFLEIKCNTSSLHIFYFIFAWPLRITP